MPSQYDREDVLKARLNMFLWKNLGLPEGDYYSQLGQDGFSELKTVLNDINNIFTVKVTLTFVEWLVMRLGLTEATRLATLSKVRGTKPNANGYDIEISNPIQIVAEVKCNVPINRGNIYGSAQRDGIVKDVDSLVRGKNKSTINPENYLKFMVLLDNPEIRQATRHLVENMKEHRDRMVFVELDTKFNSRENVYIVYVGF